ncbi:YciI family protein [Falsibacillus pallidus]|uniref:YciI family protein n=1 Tax=Falsibacillus pallidus TaxID=493781 RepID=UPI000E0B5164|nr:YciI family protein [Falsibacillus pallidus]
MFLILVNYKVPLEKIDDFLQLHIEFLDRQYKNGKLIFSGRRTPRTGGVLLANLEKRTDAEEMVKEDPFYQENLADYEIIEFTPTKYDSRFRVFIDK